MSETAAKKDVQKLQRAIVDGLEDVKAQDIRVFNTEHLSPLFERVIVASGTSNRQTKALASSVRDKVRDAGFAKPRMEGEENGEWIVVDCGAAVVHVMQPAIRQYYNLEEIWGDKPVRLRSAAPAERNACSMSGASARRFCPSSVAFSSICRLSRSPRVRVTSPRSTRRSAMAVIVAWLNCNRWAIEPGVTSSRASTSRRTSSCEGVSPVAVASLRLPPSVARRMRRRALKVALAITASIPPC